jgi:hypothetical protein
MLVMAIEAALQTADRNRTITGFRISDTLFHTPLIVSMKPEGVETQFYLRPAKDAIDQDSSYFDFKLCFFDEQWHENCRGTIKVEYQSNSHTEVDGGRASRDKLIHHVALHDKATHSPNRSVKPEELYAQLQECGFQYGIPFQALDSINYNEERVALGDVSTSKWMTKANSTQPPGNVIHPATLDGIMHLIFVVLTEGCAYSLDTMVPTGIRDLWISRSGLVQGEDGHAKALATSIRRGHRKYLISSKL